MFRNLTQSVLRQCQNVQRRTFADGFMNDMGSPSFTPRRERCLNKVTLLGRVGSVVARGTEDRPVRVVTMATNRYVRQNDMSPPQQFTEWHTVVVFNPGLATVIDNGLSKGDRILVNGALKYNKFVDDANSRTITAANIVADEMIFLQKAANRGQDNTVESDDEIETPAV